ncbi:MAG: hypothetical protein H7Z42_23550 [Roseiflexaceae bacterium]|nr:hypothetical protein [Roseiflexaceae bacterium]
MLAQLSRYGLCAAVALAGVANQRRYRMATTWLPHVAMNSFALLLPELLRIVPRPRRPHELVAAGLATLDALVCENPRYIGYIAPLSAGYLLSHPDFNIYKGAWAELKLAGLGLDAVPHGATAFALATLSGDTIEQFAQQLPAGSPSSELVAWWAKRPVLFGAVVVALATLAWEAGEYRIHLHELAQRGDASQINMQWSAADTVADLAANALGCGAAAVWRQARA